MQDQNLWGDFQVHNMEKELLVAKSEVPPQKAEIPETFASELESTKPEPLPAAEKSPVVEPIPEKAEIPQENRQPKRDSELHKIFVHLLPAHIKKHVDELYGETKHTVRYGEKTSFEGVLLAETDLALELWTDVRGIGVGSILYPKGNSLRWWKVSEIEEKAGGWRIFAVPSSYQPAFD